MRCEICGRKPLKVPGDDGLFNVIYLDGQMLVNASACRACTVLIGRAAGRVAKDIQDRLTLATLKEGDNADI